MNLKLNNEERQRTDLEAVVPYSSAEERRRTGRYVAIMVGISLLCLAIYHAWIRNIPVLASLLVPALIMLLYIAWVLYTASRDKRKALSIEADLERARTAAALRIPEPDEECEAECPNALPACCTPPTTPTMPIRADHSTPHPTNSPKTFKRSYSIA